MRLVALTPLFGSKKVNPTSKIPTPIPGFQRQVLLAMEILPVKNLLQLFV